MDWPRSGNGRWRQGTGESAGIARWRCDLRLLSIASLISFENQMAMNFKLVQIIKPSQTRCVGGQTTKSSTARVRVGSKVFNERSGANRSTYGKHGASEA